MSEDKFIFESNHNPYQLIDEISQYAEEHILSAIVFLKEFLKCSDYKVVNKYTYEITTAQSQIIKVCSFKTVFVRDDKSSCTVEVSNPYNFPGARFWTYFKNKGGYWTNQNTLIFKDIDPEICFQLLARNNNWLYKKYSEVKFKLAEGEEVSKEEKIFGEIDLYPRVISENENEKNIEKQKEELAFELLKKLFNK